MKNCLTCKYEPDWSRPIGVEYTRQTGKCKYIIKLPPLPIVYQLTINWLTRYSDDSGLPGSCPAWVSKDR